MRKIHREQEPHSGAGGRTANNDHTVVLKASVDHAVAEFQRQKTVLRVSATGGVRGVVNYHKVSLEEERERERERATDRKVSLEEERERESHRQKSFQQ